MKRKESKYDIRMSSSDNPLESRPFTIKKDGFVLWLYVKVAKVALNIYAFLLECKSKYQKEKEDG